MKKQIPRYGCVYGIRNKVTGKYYIGRTLDKRDRFSRHLKGKTGQRLSSSIKHHGKESFEIHILYDNIPEWMLPDLEEKMIQVFDSFDNGYNMMAGSLPSPSGANHYNTNIQIVNDIDKITSQYKSGISACKIAKEYNVCANTIIDHLRRAGIAIRNRQDYPHPRTRHDIRLRSKEIADRYKNGESVRMIAQDCNCSEQLISNIISEQGVKMRSSKEARYIANQLKKKRNPQLSFLSLLGKE